MGYKFWYRKVFLQDIFVSLLRVSQSQILSRHHIPQNLMWSWSLLFCSELIKYRILGSPEQGNTFCTAKMLLCLQGCLIEEQEKPKTTTNRTTTLLPPHTHTSHDQPTITELYFSMPSDYGIWQVKVWVIGKENTMSTKTNSSWKH